MRIFIFGSGGLAREVLALIEDVQVAEGWKVDSMSFIDLEARAPEMIGGVRVEVIGEQQLEAIAQDPSARFAIGIGSPKVIREISEKWGHLEFPNIVHPNFVGQRRTIKFGKGNVITAGNVFTTNITLGSFNYINLSCTLGHDSQLGDCNVVNPGVNISGNVTIGNACLVGTNATILQGVKIEDSVTLGAGALAIKNLAAGKTYVGVPARVIEK